MRQQRVEKSQMTAGLTVVRWEEADPQRPEGVLILPVAGGWKAWQNRCPHWGVPLNRYRDDILEESSGFLRCSIHGATFRPRDGVCVSGPCQDDALTEVEVIDRGDHLELREVGVAVKPHDYLVLATDDDDDDAT